MTLQATVQRRTRELRQGRLEGLEAVVERQQGMPPECDNDGILLGREGGGVWLTRAGWQVGHRSPLAPFGVRLGVHPPRVAARLFPQARLTMLDRATDRLCSSGAAVESLAHSASFHAWEKTAPSNPGIKHIHSMRI